MSAARVAVKRYAAEQARPNPSGEQRVSEDARRRSPRAHAGLPRSNEARKNAAAALRSTAASHSGAAATFSSFLLRKTLAAPAFVLRYDLPILRAAGKTLLGVGTDGRALNRPVPRAKADVTLLT